MKYINNKWTVAIIISCVSLIGCDRYDDPVVDNLTASASSYVVKVGEKVDFSISHYNTVDNLVIYTGDEGHEYNLSSDYLLTGLTNEQLADSIYRKPNPLIRKFSQDLSNLEAIPNTIEYPNMELVDDALTPGKKVLKVQLFPNDWGKVLKVYPRVGVGAENQNFTINLRFDSNDLFKKVGADWVKGSTKTNFRVVTEVIGKTSDGNVVWLFDQNAPNSLWYANVLTPSKAYFSQTINLTKWIANWEAKNKLKLQTIECITMKFVGDDNAAYKGDIFISNMTLGVDGYYPFATGTGLPIVNGTGKSTHSYTYRKPGNYNVTIIGSSNSSKNYKNDGYQSGRNNISGDEYKFGIQKYTIPIEVQQ